MKTYIRLIYKSKGMKPSEAYRILSEHKFVPTVGEYDFVYDWGESRKANLDEILSKLDAIHNALKDHDIIYEVTTSDTMYHIQEITTPSSKPSTEEKQQTRPLPPPPP